MRNLKLCCLYSYGCRMAEEKGINGLLLNHIEKESVPQEELIRALQELQSFSGYKLIAKLKRKKDPFDEVVVRSYWLGDRNQQFLINHNIATLEKIRILGIKNLVDCAVSCAKIAGFYSDAIEVFETGLFYGSRERRLDFGFLDRKKIKKGLFVSVHLGIAREIISKQQAKILKLSIEEAKGA